MITVTIKCDCFDIYQDNQNAVVKLEDDATVEDAIRKLSLSDGIDVPFEDLINRLYVINNKLVKSNTKLKDNDKLWVLYAMAGG